MWGVEDLESTNGIRVNKTKVQQTWLKPGDAVVIGKVPYRFELQSTEAADESAGKLDLDLTGASDRTVVMSPSRRSAALAKHGVADSSPASGAAPASSARNTAGRKGPGTASPTPAGAPKGSNPWLWVAGIVVIVIIGVAAANLL